MLLLLADGDADECENPLSEFALQGRELWEVYGDSILTEWVRHSPGCRPWPWWAFEAPALRLRLGGAGRPEWEEYPNMARRYAWGLPVRWRGGKPIFETQAAYLERHGLLLAGEGPPIREPHPTPASAPHWCVYR